MDRVLGTALRATFAETLARAGVLTEMQAYRLIRQNRLIAMPGGYFRLAVEPELLPRTGRVFWRELLSLLEADGYDWRACVTNPAAISLPPRQGWQLVLGELLDELRDSAQPLGGQRLIVSGEIIERIIAVVETGY